MRKIVFIVFINILAANFLLAQDQCTPVGWATQNGGVTGGGNATATVVSTYSALKTAITTASVKVIHVSGTITFPSNGRINFQDQTGKSIIGLPGARLISVDITSSGSGLLYVKRCDNIIIRNIIFEGPGAFDEDGNDNMTIDDCQNIWIDHCDFQDGMDGNLDVKNMADYISITWCKFSYLKPPIPGGSGGSDDHRYCNLIGSSDGATGDEGKLRITFQYCWWGQGCKERLPRVRFGKLHIVNNYYNSSVANHCIRAGYKADLLIESNVFENVKIPIDKYENNFTAITARNNIFTNTTGNTTGSGTSFTPPYTLNIAPAANVKSLVTNTACGAGATLDGPTQCGCGTPVNQNPTTSLTAPTNNSSVCGGTAITITATANDADGTISKVDFYNGTTLIGTDNSSPYSISYTPTSAGTLSLKSTATDNSSGVGNSSVINVTVVALPTATITAGGSTTFCTGGSVQLNANTGSGLTYQWRNGTTNISNATNSSYTATTAGTYNVIVKLGTCQTISSNTTVTVTSAPTATITAGSSTTFCTGGSVVLNANTGSGLTYQWRNGTSNIASATNSSYTATTTGTYNVIVTSGNCQATSSNTTVTVTSTPTATITAGGSTTFCTGGSVQLNANTGSGLTYQWRNGTTNISGATNSSYTAPTAGTYNVIVTSGNCQATSSNTTVTVTSAPTATITAGGSTTFCTGGSVQLNANTGSGLTYQWRNGTSNISNATNSSYTATAAGTYNVIVTSGNCQATSSNTTVTVTSAPTATITAGGSTTFCTGGSVQLNANTGSGLTYQWRNGTSNIASATNSSYTATAAGTYNVIVTSGNCQATSSNTTVTVTSAPTATITAGGSTTFCSGGSVQLNANTGSGLTYQWSNGTTNISNATNSSYTATAAGTYNVIVTSGNCQATSTNTVVTVTSVPTATITAGGSTIFCTGGSVQLNANTGSGLTYQWRNGTSNISSATNSSYIATAAGTYNVTVTSGNCQATSSNTTVTVETYPSASISINGTTSICNGDTRVLIVTPVNNATYQWLKNNSEISGATNTNITIDQPGSYSVRVTNSTSCSSTSNLIVVSNSNLPSVNISPSGVYYLNANESVTIQSSVTDAQYIYQWLKDNVAIPSATSVSYTTNELGTYTLKISNSSGCFVLSSSLEITTNTSPTISLSTPALVVYQPNAIHLSAQAVDQDGSIAKVDVYYGNVLVASDNLSPFEFVWNNPDIGVYEFLAVATDNNGATATSNTITVEVKSNRIPILQVQSTIVPATSTINSSTVLNINTSDPDGNPFVVEVLQGNVVLQSFTGESSQFVYQNSTPGSYTLTIRVTDMYGNTVEQSETVTIFGVTTTTGISNSYSLSICKIYPNPTSSTATLEFVQPSSELVDVEVVDLSGRIVYSIKNSSMLDKIQLPDQISSGMYLVNIRGGVQATLSFIKQ
ncbi:MAG: PKD domain-containing protein [Cytophagaceae bacterium]